LFLTHLKSKFSFDLYDGLGISINSHSHSQLKRKGGQNKVGFLFIRIWKNWANNNRSPVMSANVCSDGGRLDSFDFFLSRIQITGWTFASI